MELYLKDRKKITSILDDLFNKTKVRLLGSYFKGPKIYFEILEDVPPSETLEGIYRFSLGLHSGGIIDPDKRRMKKLAGILDNYIEAEKLRTLNKILVNIEKEDTIKNIEKDITIQMNKATKYMQMLLTTEVKEVQAYAEKDGIEKLSASIGDEDPTIVKLGIVDEKLCAVCRKLWHSKENINIPKPYKLSELKNGYNDMKNPFPTIGVSHPNCRHSLTYVPKNYGFNNSGQIEFKYFGYDYYEDRKDK